MLSNPRWSLRAICRFLHFVQSGPLLLLQLQLQLRRVSCVPLCFAQVFLRAVGASVVSCFFQEAAVAAERP